MYNNIRDNADQYKLTVSKYCSRIIKEKRMCIEEKYKNSKSMYTIKFYQPEWYTELDDDLKYNIIVSLQNYYSNYISTLINSNHQNYQFSRKRKIEEI